jgi:hypothetical protein
MNMGIPKLCLPEEKYGKLTNVCVWWERRVFTKIIQATIKQIHKQITITNPAVYLRGQ